MPTYRWQGLSAHGKVVSGLLAAGSEDSLRTSLLQRRVTMLVCTAEQQPERKPRHRRGIRLSPRELGLLTRQLAVMIKAGLPVVRALAALEQQHAGAPLAALLSELRHRLEGGETLASSLRAHPRLFGRLYTAMIAAGEATGDMDLVLGQLSTHLERSAGVRSKVHGALLYPAIVIVVASAVTGGLLVFVVPVFAELFRSFGQELPLPTRIVVALSTLVTEYAALGIAMTLATTLLAYHALRAPEWRCRLDRVALHAPLVGAVLRRAEVAKLARVLSAVITAGVPLLESLQLATEAAASSVFREALAKVEQLVREGVPLAQSLSGCGLFPENVCQLVSIGETTGSLESSWLKIAELYEAEIDHWLSNLTALIEPLFIAVLGVVVGTILIALYLPIFRIGALVQ